MDIDSVRYDLFEQESEIFASIFDEWTNKKGNPDARQAWRVIPANMLIREWQYNAYTGFIHEKVIDKIQKIVIENCLKLNINTILMGHESVTPFHYFEGQLPDGWDEPTFEEWLKDFEWFAMDEDWNWRISDFALDQVYNHVISLVAEEYYPNKLYWIDRILNIVHQRSDLASWFVEGGSSTLNRLSND